jgi:methionyl-tRNA formyltransferase
VCFVVLECEMKLIFAGTPEFAARALAALITAGHEIALVLTQPDRPAGRGMKLTPSSVKQLALQHGLPVAQPLTLKDVEAQQMLRDVGADAMVVAAYGLILPEAVLDIPPLGCLNIHASLLPRWRGAAPIQRAILAGDSETGVTIMQMDVGLDTGAMLLKRVVPITVADNAASLHDKLAEAGGEAIVSALTQLAQGTLPGEAQDDAQANYAAKLSKEEARVDWQRPASELARAVRGYNPFPGAFTSLQGEPLKLWQAAEAEGKGQPGKILAADSRGVLVACGDGALLVTELQRAGGKRLAVAQFLAGNPMPVGQTLGG